VLDELPKQWRHTHAVENRTQQPPSGSHSSLEVPSGIRMVSSRWKLLLLSHRGDTGGSYFVAAKVSLLA
jgi:hypothetical protein